MNNNYCSLVSAHVEEPQFATAPVNERFLLLEYDQPWGKDAIEESRIDAEVKTFLDEQIRKDIFSRILLIRGGPRNKDNSVLHVFACNNRSSDPFLRLHRIKEYRELLTLDIAALFNKEEEGLIREPLYLVCTNGKTDKCCSRFGLPVYQALKRLGTNIWQASHVTGDRFAPNVVQIPYTHYYGRLQLAELQEFYTTMQQGLIYRRQYRGRASFTQEQQATEHFLRESLDDYRYEGIRFLHSATPEEGVIESSFYCEGRGTFLVRVRLSLSEEEFLLNCDQKKSKVKVYTLDSIVEAGPGRP